MKHVKILGGHSVKEWESKFQKKIAKGKIKVFNSENELLPCAKYWKIGGKYYQVPYTPFEWYCKLLRKYSSLVNLNTKQKITGKNYSFVNARTSNAQLALA